MPNIGTVMRDEITRLSRRASRRDLESMKKASAQQRRHIAALKRDVASLARQVSALSRRVPQQSSASIGEPQEGKRVRFAPKGLRSHRDRLGLSADDLAKLVGVSAQSIYNWERGVTRPRAAQIGVLAGLRSIGKREARARVEELASAGSKRSRRKPSRS